MLYPVLHRLERQGLIESHWGESEIGRKRKYYRLCQDGKQVLEQERQHWRMVDGMLNQLWKGEPQCLMTINPILSGC
jgi:DNA-binding PadR family transcriptional regulator